MKYWIFVYKPETYEKTKAEKITGVGKRGKKAFCENISIGDKFVAYVSGSRQFVAVCEFTSDPIFSESATFPWLREFKFLKEDLEIPATELFWGIAPFNSCDTVPGNLLMLKGGFVEITGNDYEWLLSEFGNS